MRADHHNTILGLNEWGYLGGGMSSANFLYNFFMISDLKNLVFIGQDLAFGEDGNSHSKNHVIKKNEIKHEVIGEITAYGGVGKVKTHKYWNIFLNDFIFQIEYTNEHLNKKTFNSTEGGARIDGSIEIPFEEFCNKYVDVTKPKEPIVLEAPTDSFIKENTQKYTKKQIEIIKLAKSVSKKSHKIFNDIEMFLKNIENLNDNNSINKISVKEIDRLYEKIMDVRKKYNSKVFVDTFSLLLSAYVNSLEYDIAKVHVMRENTPEAVKLKKINFIKIHYEWTYRLFMSLNEIIKIIEESLENRQL